MELLDSMPAAVKFVIAFLLLLALLAPLLWRRFNIGAGHARARGRQPRLSVIETTAVDVRHRLVLVKRDNVEHLLLVGGPTNIVVESNIARTPPGAREPRPIPAIPDGHATDAARHQQAAADTPDWALPMEPAMARPVRTVDLDAALPEPPARTAREAMVDSMRAVRSGAAARRGPPPDFDNPPEEIAAPALTPPPVEGHRQPPPEPRWSAAAAPGAEPQRPEPVQPAAEAPEPRRERPPPPPRPVQPMPPTAQGGAAPPPRPHPAASAPPVPHPSRPAPSEEGNFAEMAQRLEAALRRPTKTEPPPPPVRSSARPEPPTGRKPTRPDGAAPARPGARPVDNRSGEKLPEPPPPPDLKVLPGKGKNESALDNLENEMARMLGRPGKS